MIYLKQKINQLLTLKKNLIFTEIKLKETLQRKLSIHLNNTSLKDELESVDKSGIKKSCFSNQALGSIIKRNIQKSLLNKNLKKEKISQVINYH